MMKLINRMQVGSTWVNPHLNLGAEFPWGSFKESSLGKETGMLGREACTQTKLVSVKCT